MRELQRRVRARGVEPVSAADEATTGPADFVVVDADGNPVMFDQHVRSPAVASPMRPSIPAPVATRAGC